MEPKNLDDILRSQRGYLEEMRERIASFEERCSEYWNGVLDTIFDPEEDEEES